MILSWSSLEFYILIKLINFISSTFHIKIIKKHTYNQNKYSLFYLWNFKPPPNSWQVVSQKVQHRLVILWRHQLQYLWYFCLYLVFVWFLPFPRHYLFLFALVSAITIAESFRNLATYLHIIKNTIDLWDRTLGFVFSKMIVLSVIFTVFAFTGLPTRLVGVEAFTVFF